MTAEFSDGQIAHKEILFSQRYKVGSHTGGVDLWKAHGRKILEMHRDVLGPLFTDFEGEAAQVLEYESALELEYRMRHPDSVFVALQERTTDQLVGFTFAAPNGTVPGMPYEKDEFKLWQEEGMSLEDYSARQRRTFYVGHTMVKPDHQSQGGWSHMMDVLEMRMRSLGRYDEMTRVVRQDNGLAQRVKKRYPEPGKIVTAIPNQPGPIGPQTYYRIKL